MAPARRSLHRGHAGRGARDQRLHARARLVHDRPGLDPSGYGCWEATGSYKGHELTYVYDVPPRVLSAPAPAAGGDGAIVAGTVTFAEASNCYRVGDSPVVWPYGTEASEDGQTLSLADGTEVRVGDRVSGGGGYSSRDSLLHLGIPDECFGPNGEIAVFNASSPIEVTP